MKFQFLCFLIFIVFTIDTLQNTISLCPAICKCTSPSTVSDQCFICLQKHFKRNFRIQNKTCPCIQNYVQNYPPADYCCAKNCTICYWQGCYECRANWTRTKNGAYYICVCKQYYKYDPILDDCICLGDQKEYSLSHYALIRSQCYACPQGCICDKWGCLYCTIKQHRVITNNFYNFSYCQCSPEYTEINGLCVQMINDNISKCESPRILLVNGTCICRNPYYQDNNKDCKCKSILDPTSYYLYLDTCYECPSMCYCNKLGCIYCSILANRIINQNHCPCVDDTGIFQQNGQCICISPYNKTCHCNNRAYPSLFFTNSNNLCKKCPYGCICDQSGCNSCNSISNRNQTCQCHQPFTQLDGLCIGCGQNFIYINYSCVCATIFSPDSYYYDSIQKKCNYCPPGCKCNSQSIKNIDGCNLCDNNLHRVIKQYSDPQSTQKHYTCYCDFANNFQQNSLYECQCIPPYVFNSTSNNCECQYPYYPINNTCICNSSQAYYSYTNTDCRPCPLECNCSIIGCYSCSTKTGRTIIIGPLLNYICPCFPIQNTINSNFCRVCNQNQYLWQNECIDCNYNCKTCDEYGCLTCKKLMYLLNKTCVCSAQLYYNEGSCICRQEGFFLKEQTCVACPLNCVNCQFNYQIQNMIECLECNISAFRKRDRSQQCPCIDYYVEAPQKKSFCCHRNCIDCNISGCISCLAFSYRQLNYTDKNNVTCSCMKGFVQTYYAVCSCPPKTYIYQNKCEPCMQYCLKCSLVLQIISCTKCVDGLKRQNKINQQISTNNISSMIYDCICIPGYQSYANQTHCYPNSCKVLGENGMCAICESDRIQTKNVSYCYCPIGYYEDQSFTCQPCSEGCNKCLSFDICESCNIDNGYYSVFNKKQMIINCVKSDLSLKIFYQEKENVLLEIKNINNSFHISTKNLSIYLIFLTRNVSTSTIKLNLLECKIINTNILIIRFNNFTKDQLNPFLLYMNSTDQHGTVFQNYYLMEDRIYTTKTISYSNIQQIFIYLFIAIIMFTSLIFNILGEKHNQLMYYCQTLYFIAMNITDLRMNLVPFLNYFWITIFNFTFFYSGSPFNSLISDWTVYFQNCYGNYRYFNVDNNLLRNVGLALYLIMQNLCLETIFQIIYRVLFRSKHKMFAKKYKKLVYRTLQWISKSIMYPLLFFSLSTLILYQRQFSLTDQPFRWLNRSAAILILVAYIVSTLIKFMVDQISKIYKYERLLEFFFNIINSIIIITSVYSQYILFALIPSMLLKSILQYVKYRKFMRDVQYLYNYINVLNLIQCLIIIPIYFCNLIGTVTLMLLYIFGIMMLRIYLIIKKQKKAKLERKILNVVDVIESKIQQKYIDNSYIKSHRKMSQNKQIQMSQNKLIQVLQ